MTITVDERARRAAAHQRVLSRDWRDVPAGYYAIPVYDFDSWDGEGDPAVIAFRTFRRSVARVTKTGRVFGVDRFTVGVVMHKPDADHGQASRDIAADREAARDVYGPHGDVLVVLDAILEDVAGPDTLRANYGRFTGRCGRCHKRLTHPESKLRGIGPNAGRLLAEVVVPLNPLLPVRASPTVGSPVQPKAGWMTDGGEPA